MPIGPTRTKAQKQAVVHKEMSKFKVGELHSGSKLGPVVKSHKQAIAISLSESDQNRAPKVGKDESKGAVDRSAHHKDNPGFPNVTEMATATLQHRFPAASGACTFGHGVDKRHGALRLSGNPSAHQIGRKK